MTTVVALQAAAAAVLCGAVAWWGSVLGARLARAQPPLDDAPPPVRYRQWPFVVLGSIVGAASAHDVATPEVLLIAVVIGLLAACAAADLRCGIIPDRCSLGVLALVLIVSGFRHDWYPGIGAAVLAVAFACTALISRGRGMGWGDVKLAAAGGALLGPADAALAFAAAAMLAYALALRAGRASQPIAFGPYLAASTAIALAFQRPV
jgi:prepilin signal peptidase PulO-like enzyme (type II secretory pathway)